MIRAQDEGICTCYPARTMASKKKAAPKLTVSGVRGARVLATGRPGLFIVRVGAPVATTPEDQRAGPLLRKVGRALASPGVSREAVFGPDPKARNYAYSIDPADPTRMIREDAFGNRATGRMVDGRFRKLSPRS